MDGGCGCRVTALCLTVFHATLTLSMSLRTLSTAPGIPTAMPDNKNLTTDQENALAIYRNLEQRLGEPPSVRVFAEALGKSHSSAHHFILQFRKKGYVSMRPITIIRPRLTAKGRKAK